MSSKAPSAPSAGNPLDSAAIASAAAARAEFTKYVMEITDFQRDQIATRVDKLAKHQSSGWSYFIACNAIAVSASLIGMKYFGPRHALNHRVYLVRPIPPAIGVGVCVYCILYYGRLLMMKFRLWGMLEDYEYQIKKAQAHHVPEGATHLAWMQFVLDQIRADKAPQLDINALRRRPVLM